MTLERVWSLGKLAAVKWNEHNAPRLSAALAYYSLLSLAPVVVLLIAIYGLAFNRGAATQYLLDQAQNVLGSAGVDAIKALIDNLHQTKAGVPAGIVAVIVLCFSASGVFAELRESLNTIWEAPDVSTCVRQVILRRIVSIALVLALGIFLLASLFLSAALHVFQTLLTNSLPNGAFILEDAANVFLSFLAVTVLFGLIFKIVPDVAIDWRDVIFGAVTTSLLFSAGRWLLSIYLARAAVGSVYGAAGSLVVFLVWLYYSAQIFLFGAVLTRVYSNRFGCHQPK